MKTNNTKNILQIISPGRPRIKCFIAHSPGTAEKEEANA